jgi:hypothetical protein
MTDSPAARIAELEAKVQRLRLQVERWQAVAYVDGADLTARARAEGITVETGREREFCQFIREFEAKPPHDT